MSKIITTPEPFVPYLLGEDLINKIELFKERHAFHSMIKDLTLFERLTHVQASIEPIKRNAKGYNYAYARLDDIYETVLPTLNLFGLFHHSEISRENPDINQVFINCARTGEFISTDILMIGLFDDPIDEKEKKKPKMQRMGSLITYSTRYGVLKLLGICPDNDTDAAEVTSSNNKGSYQSAYKKPEPAKVAYEEPIDVILDRLDKLWKEKKSDAFAFDSDTAVKIDNYAASDYDGANRDKLNSMHKWLMRVPARVEETVTGDVPFDDSVGG